MLQKLIGNFALFFIPVEPRGHLTMFACQHFIALQEFFNLQRVIGERLGCCINRRQSTTDHHRRQTNLHIGNRISLAGTRELQPHQKIGCRAYAPREAIGHIKNRGTTCPQRQRHMIKTHLKRHISRDRATKTHATEQCELTATLDQ